MLRFRPWQVAAWTLVLGQLTSAHGQAPGPSLVLQVPVDLHAGQHAVATLDVRLPSGAAQPLLVTPFRDGGALEVVRGRFLRADARTLADGTLRFELPLLAHEAGSVVLGAKVLAYVCEKLCKQVELETRVNVQVLPAGATK